MSDSIQSAERIIVGLQSPIDYYLEIALATTNRHSMIRFYVKYHNQATLMTTISGADVWFRRHRPSSNQEKTKLSRWFKFYLIFAYRPALLYRFER
jgi:hypothetical protein